MESARVRDIVDIKDYTARYVTDVISSAAFGIEAHSLKNPNAIIRKMGKEVVEPKLSLLLRQLISFGVPDLARLLKVKDPLSRVI